jgi:hypothetical protein
MRGRKTSLRVVLTAEGRSHLEQRLRSTTISLGLAWLGLAWLGGIARSSKLPTDSPWSSSHDRST